MLTLGLLLELPSHAKLCDSGRHAAEFQHLKLHLLVHAERL